MQCSGRGKGTDRKRWLRRKGPKGKWVSKHNYIAQSVADGDSRPILEIRRISVFITRDSIICCSAYATAIPSLRLVLVGVCAKQGLANL